MRWWRGSSDKENKKPEDGKLSEPPKNNTSDLSNYDCYSILGVTFNASKDEIKRAYRRLALQYHPDRNKSEEAIAIFRVIQMAYDTLLDEGKRRHYDSTIPALANTKQNKVKVELEGAFTEGYESDDAVAISIANTDEAIVFENSVTVPSIWIHSGDLHRQYSVFTDVAFERLFKALFGIINPKEGLKDLEVSGSPKLRAHFDARFWNRGQTNVSMYCYSSISFTIINGLPYIYMHGARYHNVQQEITVEFYTKMKEAINAIIRAELSGTVEPPAEIAEPATMFQPVKLVSDLRLPPLEICSAFTTVCRTKSAQEAIDMLSKVYGVPSMKMVFQHRFPVNDMVCKDALAVYYGEAMTAYFKPEGTTMVVILHEFYHHLVSCYGARDNLDYQLIPDQITGYYARNEREERAADSYARMFLRRAIG
jgi:curved DNA-binding protein CbpA